MIRIKGRAVTYGELWYGETPSDITAVDILIHRQRREPIPAAHSVPFVSMYTDLTEAESTIIGKFNTTCTYAIRRADARDGLRSEFIADPEDGLAEFSDFFNTFARQKAIWLADQEWLRGACSARQLVLSSARQADETLVWHAHLIAGRHARLAYSASCYRGRSSDYRSLVGRANRWLHWQDMLQFKERGFSCYDWGGLFDDDSTPERAGINGFKQSFGGTRVRVFDSTVPVTRKGRIWIPLREAWRHWKPAQPAKRALPCS